VRERRDETGVDATIEDGGASKKTMMTETMTMEKKTTKK
jgi:hypothetical protein